MLLLLQIAHVAFCVFLCMYVYVMEIMKLNLITYALRELKVTAFYKICRYFESFVSFIMNSQGI